MSDNISITEWLKNVEAGKYDAKDVSTMIKAGWYDWFCRDTSLHTRLKKMIPLVKAAAACPLIDADKHYVFFKNNAPCSGGTYDSFSICTLDEASDVVWWISPRCSHAEGPVVVHADIGFGLEHNLIGRVELFHQGRPECNKERKGGIKAIKRFFKKDTVVLHRLINKNLKHNY